MARHGPEVRRAVRAAYVFDRLALAAAAARAGVPVSTATKWKVAAKRDGDDWDKARAGAALTGGGLDTVVEALVDDYVRLHQATIEGLYAATTIGPIDKARALASLADSLTKTTAALGRVSPELSRFAVAQDVIRRLGEFVAARYPQHGPAFVEILEPFAAALGEAYG